MNELQTLRSEYERVRQAGLALNIERGQPGDDNFDLANGMLTAVSERDLVTPSGIAIRNYPGGVTGLPEARELFSTVLRVKPSQMLVAGNSSLKLLADLLMWARIRGLHPGQSPWNRGNEQFIVTVPGYDRHFTLLEALGFGMVSVPMTHGGPDMGAVEELAASDPSIKALLFVPTYSNPTGDTVSPAVVRRLASMRAAAPDFTIFADDAYAVHHLVDEPTLPPSLLPSSEASGTSDRVFLFGSTSKITFAGSGLGFLAASEGNIAHLSKLFSSIYIGPDKVEQYRHVRFLASFPGGIPGLMRRHAELLRPKFAAVQEVLKRELGGSGLASWSDPKGGYFVSLTTARPVAKRVVELAKQTGVALTAAGSTFPYGKDPSDSNIRLAPTRPSVEEVRAAMEVVALCVKLASAEERAARESHSR